MPRKQDEERMNRPEKRRMGSICKMQARSRREIEPKNENENKNEKEDICKKWRSKKKNPAQWNQDY
jgi:hypothetical protein